MSEKEIADKTIEVKGNGQMERYTQLNAEFERIARKDEKSFFVINTKKYKKIEWERLEISSRKLEIPREHFM